VLATPRPTNATNVMNFFTYVTFSTHAQRQSISAHCGALGDMTLAASRGSV